MAFTFHTDCNAQELDAFVMNSEQNNLFQCSNWAKVKNNWDSYLTCVKEDGKIVASALVLIRPLILGKTLAYIPRGPIMDYSRNDLVVFTLNHLKDFAKSKHAAALRFDPYVRTRKYPYEQRDNKPAEENLYIIDELEKIGCKHRGMTTYISEATQPRFNAEVDVETNYEDQLKKKTRKCIRTAERRGVKIYAGPEYLDDFVKVLHDTEQKQGISLRTKEYFVHMIDVYQNDALLMVAKINLAQEIENLTNHIHLANKQLQECDLNKREKRELAQTIERNENLLTKFQNARKEDGDEVTISGSLSICSHNLMERLYMGNNSKYSYLHGNYLLYAKGFEQCVKRNIHYCSLGGIEGTLDDHLTSFKSNWPMNVEEYVGEFNCVFSKIIYMLFDQLYPKLRQFLVKIKKK